MTQTSRAILLAALTALLWFGPAAAIAQDDRSATPTERIIQEAFAVEPALVALQEAGAKPGRLLVLERLPDGASLVEFEIEVDEKRGRVPLRISDSKVEWAPSPEYCTALVNMLRSGALPASDSDRQWADIARLPSFPVIVTAKRVITPFGAIGTAIESSVDDDANPLKRPQPKGPLPTSQALAQHANRWISETLANDPAPAGFDLIVDASIDWKTFNAALFSIASTGLYLGEVIANTGKSFVAIPFAAPIGTATVGKPPSLILAFYKPADTYEVRVVFKGTPAPAGKGCPDRMALCGADPAAYGPGLLTLLSGEMPETAMFASIPTTRTSDGIAFIEHTIDALKLAPHRLFIGFIAL